MKLLSWNVNGIRACLKKDFIKSISKYNPDIICLQEIKAHKDQVDIQLKDYKYNYWNSAERKGYSGTAIFSKIKPISVKYGIGNEADIEGRTITIEFKDYYLVTVYTPNSKRGLERLEFRYNSWDKDFLKYIKNLSKPTIFCGDLNVAHNEIDLSRPDGNKTTNKNPGNAGFTDKERKGFDNIIDAGFIDSYRELNPKKIKYSWWSYMFKSRDRNIGWRIDYFCIDKSLKKRMKKAEILTDIFGSDHCPIILEIN